MVRGREGAVQLALAGAEVIASGSPVRGDGLTQLGAQEIVVGLDGISSPVFARLDNVGGQTLTRLVELLEPGGRVLSVGRALAPTSIDLEHVRAHNSGARIEAFAVGPGFGADLGVLLHLLADGGLELPMGLARPGTRSMPPSTRSRPGPCRVRPCRGWGHDGPLTPADQVATLAQVLDRPLRYEPLSDAEARAEMAASAPPEIVDALFRFFSEGEFDDAGVVDTAAVITGHPARSFSMWTESNRHRFGTTREGKRRGGSAVASATIHPTGSAGRGW